MNEIRQKVDVCVVGAGHAGCEAALACARLGLNTIIFTVNVDSIALMPCNPNIGGSSKGHLVRELDALGGEMGKNIDKTFIQSKMLNISKGPAVHSLRAQADKAEYSKEMRKVLEQQENPECGIYVMPVDADDLLNYQIAGYCEAHPDANGFVSKDGYVWQEGSSIFCIYPQMHTYCGSCNIIKMYRDDLPERIPFPIDLCHDGHTAGILNSRYPIRLDHNIIVERYSSINKPFSTLPFRSTVYVRGTGDNISCIPLKEKEDPSKKRKGIQIHPIAFLRKINIFKIKYISQKIRSEFGINS